MEKENLEQQSNFIENESTDVPQRVANMSIDRSQNSDVKWSLSARPKEKPPSYGSSLFFADSTSRASHGRSFSGNFIPREYVPPTTASSSVPIGQDVLNHSHDKITPAPLQHESSVSDTQHENTYSDITTHAVASVAAFFGGDHLSKKPQETMPGDINIKDDSLDVVPSLYSAQDSTNQNSAHQDSIVNQSDRSRELDSQPYGTATVFGTFSTQLTPPESLTDSGLNKTSDRPDPPSVSFAPDPKIPDTHSKVHDGSPVVDITDPKVQTGPVDFNNTADTHSKIPTESDQAESSITNNPMKTGSFGTKVESSESVPSLSTSDSAMSEFDRRQPNKISTPAVENGLGKTDHTRQDSDIIDPHRDEHIEPIATQDDMKPKDVKKKSRKGSIKAS